MSYPEAYVDYLVHFNGTRDYFECHEELEDYWKEKPRGQRDAYWVGFIQLAVSMYHHRRGNFSGAKRTMSRAIELLEDEHQTIEALGIDYHALLSWMHERFAAIEAHEPYKSGLIPIKDDALLAACYKRCEEFGCQWGEASNLNDPFLVDKHKQRDRTDVIQARRESLDQKERSRKS